LDDAFFNEHGEIELRRRGPGVKITKARPEAGRQPWQTAGNAHPHLSTLQPGAPTFQRGVDHDAVGKILAEAERLKRAERGVDHFWGGPTEPEPAPEPTLGARLWRRIGGWF
jgi:hypothetical protein